ncbi:MAG: ROK family protein [Bacteroidales bacterium]|nr:ROK family protein [Bacteroidales bacterium]MCF8457536.1 ROK family protein [Bacteroidales bacterium]
MRTGIGVDIGGTHIASAAVELDTGHIIENTYNEILIDSAASPCRFLADLTNVISTSLEFTQGGIAGFSLAFPGPFDYDKGISKINGLSKLDTLFGVNIKQYLKSQLAIGKETSIEFINDAEAFALGEYYYGKAMGFKNVLAITVGTGFGSTFIQNDSVKKSGKGIPDGGFLYNQPFNKSFADDYFSTRWFENTWFSKTSSHIKGVKEIFDLANAGDRDAKNLFEQFGRHLADFLTPWIKSSQTECLVIGGSISKAWKHFFHHLKVQFLLKGVNIQIKQSDYEKYPALTGAAKYLDLRQVSAPKELRKTTQFLAPTSKTTTKKGEYDIYPGFKIEENSIQEGYVGLADWISKYKQVIIDGYVGVFWEDIKDNLSKEFDQKGLKVIWHEIDAALLSTESIDQMIKPWLGSDDPIFGLRCELPLIDFFNKNLINAIKPDSKTDINIVIGTGAALSNWDAPLVYFDIPKNELQFRMRAKTIWNLGAIEPGEPKPMYKRFYFVDWPVLNKHKKNLIPDIQIIVDDQRPAFPIWTEGDVLRKALLEMSHNLFRVRPWFEPGVWGGTWMKKNIKGLSQTVPNYAWSFEMIVPENGLLLEDNGKILEVSFDMLMYAQHHNVLGEAADRFGFEFPIRFDYLDTFDGGNLSIQCHPKETYIKEQFGEQFTQDETYYILDTKDDAQVYLGFQESIQPQDFRKELEKSFKESTEVDIQKYVQAYPANKHDLFLIPNCTIHGSGKNNLVLEISSTPYIFTFKLYDWVRLDLDGNPRPMNIKRGFENLDFSRKGEKVGQELISKPYLLEKGEDWELFHLPTHPEHFYDVYRYHFIHELDIETKNQCHVLMLVEGSSIIIETENGLSQRFNYAETFVIPAAAQSYKIINESNELAMLVKAFVKSEKC